MGVRVQLFNQNNRKPIYFVTNTETDKTKQVERLVDVEKKIKEITE